MDTWLSAAWSHRATAQRFAAGKRDRGRDLLTGRRVWHRKTVRTEVEAQIALGRLLEAVAAVKRPDSRVTVGELLERYLEVADLDLSTRRTYEGYIRRTILPAAGAALGRQPGPDG